MTPDDERRAIGEVIDRISGRLPGVARTLIEATVGENLRQFDDHPIRDFLPSVRRACDHRHPGRASSDRRLGRRAGQVSGQG